MKAPTARNRIPQRTTLKPKTLILRPKKKSTHAHAPIVGKTATNVHHAKNCIFPPDTTVPSAEGKGIVVKLLGLKNLVLRSAKVSTAPATVGKRATVVKHAKNYISRQSTSAPDAEEPGIVWNTIKRNSLPRINPPAPIVMNTATIVMYVQTSIFGQNTSAPSAENWGILDKPVHEPARPKSEIIEPMGPCHGWGDSGGASDMVW